MKKFYSVPFIIALLFISVDASSQAVTAEQSKAIGDIFLKGNWNYTINQRLNYQNWGVKVDDNKTGTESEFNTWLQAENFVADNFFVGGELGFNTDTKKDEGSDDKDIDRRFFIGATGGWGDAVFDDRLPLRARLKFGVGQTADIYKNGEVDKQTAFRWRVAAELGVPLNVYKNRFFFEPTIGYRLASESNDDYTETRSGLYIKGKLNFSLGCDEDMCDIERDWDVPDGRYAPGTLQIGGGPKLKLGFGTNTTTWTGEGGEEIKSKDSYTDFQLQGGGYIYPIEYLGVGAGFHVNTSSNRDKDSDYKTSNTGITFMPMVIGHVPVEGPLNQAFVDVGFGIGSQTSKTTGASFDQTDKNSVTELYAGVGYDYFVHDNMSIALNVGYSSITSKDKDTDLKTKNNGVVVGFTWNAFLKTW